MNSRRRTPPTVRYALRMCLARPLRRRSPPPVSPFMPVLLPILVLFLPVLDMMMAIVRRLRKGQSPMHPDRMHLHRVPVVQQEAHADAHHGNVEQRGHRCVRGRGAGEDVRVDAERDATNGHDAGGKVAWRCCADSSQPCSSPRGWTSCKACSGRTTRRGS